MLFSEHNATTAQFQQASDRFRPLGHDFFAIAIHENLIVCDQRGGQTAPFRLGQKTEGQLAFAAAGGAREQDPVFWIAMAVACRLKRSTFMSFGRRQRQGEASTRDHAVFVDDVFGPQATAMGFRNLAADGQAEAGILAETFACRSVGVEALKNPVDIFAWMPGPLSST